MIDGLSQKGNEVGQNFAVTDAKPSRDGFSGWQHRISLTSKNRQNNPEPLRLVWREQDGKIFYDVLRQLPLRFSG
jgi:hypothetical protein